MKPNLTTVNSIQFSDTTEMIEKQKLECQDNVLNACSDGKHILPMHKVSQVESPEILQHSQTLKVEESLDALFTKYFKVPESTQKLVTFLKQTQIEPQSIINVLGPTKTTGTKELSEDTESIDGILLKYLKFPKFSLKLSNFLKNNTTELELKNITNKLCCLDSTAKSSANALSKPNIDISFCLKKMETLGVAIKMIESLVNASTRTLDDSARSKFQNLFLQHLNSKVVDHDASEHEENINYAEMESNQERVFGKKSCKFSSNEKLRSSFSTEDLCLVIDFFLEEVDKLSASVTSWDVGSRAKLKVDSLEIELRTMLFISDVGDSDFQRQKDELESKLSNLKKMVLKLHDLKNSVYHTSFDSDMLPNSDDNILLEPALSCVSLLSLTDSEYKTKHTVSDPEINSRKVSFDMARPIQDNFCVKCEKYYELTEQELQHENAALQERLSEQLLQISILKSHIEEDKYRCNTPQKSKAVNYKIEELLESNEKQREINKKLIFEKREFNEDLTRCKEIIKKKDNLIALLQEKLSCVRKEKLIDIEQSDKLHYKELERNVKITVELEKENAHLKSEVKQLNAEVVHLKECLTSAEEQVEMNQSQMNSQCKKIENFSQISMQLEAKLTTLEEVLEECQAKEEKLQQVIQQMQMDSKGSMKNLRQQIEQWRIKWDDVQKNHSEVVENLREQIQILCRQLEKGDVEDIDIADVQREIMEASSFLKANDSETYGNLVYFLVKKAVDSRLSQMTRKHELHINLINETWEQSIKIKMLKIKKEVQDKFKIKYGNKVNDLNKLLANKDEMLKEFENSIDLEKMVLSQTVKILDEDLESQRMKEKVLEDKHKEEISNLKELFEKRWFTEMKKVQAIQVEELKKLKDSKEKTVKALCNHLFAKYEEKWKGLQDEYALKIEDEKGREVQRHKEELKNLQLMLERRFEKEKKQIVELKDKESRRLVQSLRNIWFKNIHELHRSGSSTEHKSSSGGTRHLEEEQLRMSAAHTRDVSEFRRELDANEEEHLQLQLRDFERAQRRLEEAYML